MESEPSVVTKGDSFSFAMAKPFAKPMIAAVPKPAMSARISCEPGNG